MPRNVSGTYTLPLPPVVPNTTIESDWANETLADISQALTDSLDRTGRGGLTAPFRLVDGTAAQPGLSFNAETGTGLYRAAPGQMGVTVMGTAVGGWTVDGFSGFVAQIDGDPIFTGTVTIDDALVLNGPAEFDSGVTLKGAGAAIEWWNTSAPVDMQRYSAFASVDGDWLLTAVNDANTVVQHYFTLRRSGTPSVPGVGIPGWFINKNLTVEASSDASVLGLDATAASIPRAIQYRTNGFPRWNIEVTGSEGGANSGSDFGIARSADNGAYAGAIFKILRSNGVATFYGSSVRVFGDSTTSRNASYVLNAVADSDFNTIDGHKGGVFRWQLVLGSGDAGGNLDINRYNDAGGYTGTPFSINRGSGAATFANALTVGGNLSVTGNTTTTGQFISHSSIEIGHPAGGSTPFIDFHTTAGSDFDARIIASGSPVTMQYIAGGGVHSFTGAEVRVETSLTVRNANIKVSHGAGGFPTLELANDAGQRKFIRTQPNNHLEIVNAGNTAVILDLEDSGRFSPSAGYMSKAGSSAGWGGSLWNYQWDGNVAIWIDSTRIGWINVSTSDERIKHDIAPMGLLDEDVFAKITPIKFRWRNIGVFIDDGVDHWGFSAQNLLDYVPAAVKGSVTETGPDGEIYPANVDLMAILGQTILQLQNLQARCTAAGI